MLDTLTLNVGNYELKPIHCFKTLYEIDCQGQQLSEYIRPCKEVPHLTVSLKNSKTNIKNEYQRSLFVQVDSLAKTLYGSSLYEVKETDRDRTFDFIESSLNEIGVKVNNEDVYNARLSRLDICRNLEVEHSISDYINSLSNFEMSRTDKTEFKHQTITFGNSLRQFAFYNKVAQIKQDKKIDAKERKLAESRAEDILRVEARKLKNRAVKSTFKCQPKLAELFNYDLCRKELLREFNRLISCSDEQLMLNFQDDIELAKELGSIGEFFKIKGMDRLLKEYNYDFKQIREFLEQTELLNARTHVYYWINKLKKRTVHSLKQDDRNLIAEIKQKLAA